MSGGQGYEPDEITSGGSGRMPGWMKVSIGLLAAVVVVIIAWTSIGPGSVPPRPAAVVATRHGVICQPLRVPVLLQPPLSGWRTLRFSVTRQDLATITGQLCTPIGPGGIKGWQVLIPGYTYGAYYFNFPRPGYSYVHAANAAGWATLDLNRPGTDAGPFPPAADLTAVNEAGAVDQVIRDVEPQFAAGGHRAPVIVSHSFGSAVAVELAALDPAAVRAVVVSGWMNNDNPQGRAAAAKQAEPASLDPMLAARPAGYLTTKPGGRWKAFYNPYDASRFVSMLDDLDRTTGTAAELASITGSESPAVAARVRAPILFAMGGRDALNCSVTDPALACDTPAVILARERHLYRVPVSASVVPQAGHDVLLARDGSLWTRQVLTWAGELR